MIKLLSMDTSEGAPFPDASIPEMEKLAGLKLSGGNSLAGKFPALTLLLEEGYEAPGVGDYFQVGSLKVVSEKLKLAFERAQAELEYFPVVVIYEDDPTETPYFVANPLKRIHAIDQANSIAKFDQYGFCSRLEKLVLDESTFDDTNLAVVHGIARIGVQEEVARIVEAAGCTGLVFVDADTIRN